MPPAFTEQTFNSFSGFHQEFKYFKTCPAERAFQFLLRIPHSAIVFQLLGRLPELSIPSPDSTRQVAGGQGAVEGLSIPCPDSTAIYVENLKLNVFCLSIPCPDSTKPLPWNMILRRHLTFNSLSGFHGIMEELEQEIKAILSIPCPDSTGLHLQQNLTEELVFQFLVRIPRVECRTQLCAAASHFQFLVRIPRIC